MIIQALTPDEYPILYRELHIRKGALLQRLEQIIELGDTFPGWPSYPAAVDELIRRYRGSASTWHEAKAYFAALGLLEVRKPTTKSTSSAMQESVRRAGKGRRAVIWIRIPDYTPERLSKAESAAKRLKEKGVNRKGLNKQGLIVAVEREQANRIIIDGRTRSNKDKAAEFEIVRQMRISIRRKGYARKDEVIRRAAKRMASVCKLDRIEAFFFVQNVWANRNKRLLKMAGAKYKRPGKAEKERFKQKGNGWIITPT